MSYNGEQFIYDAIGNPTTYRGKNLVWTGRQLDNYDGLTFLYNGDGVRVKKGNTKFYVNGTKIIAQDNGSKMLFHYGADGITGFSYCLSDDVVQSYFYRKNAQGDITGIYDNNNNLLCQYVYDAWGNHKVIVDETNANAVFITNLNPFRYRGYYYDTETGLYYLNSRYYDPQTGRFINADDISNIDTGNLNGLNIYAYCGNNPVMNIDPNGKFLVSFLVGLFIASATVAIVNTGAQLVSDVVDYAMTGQWNSGWEDYAGAFIGGFAGGATFFLTGGNLAATFGVTNGMETLVTSLLTNTTGKTSFNGIEILSKTIFSFSMGLLTGKIFKGTRIPTITIGRNSMLSIWKSGLTRLIHNNASRMSLNVITKGLISFGTLKSIGSITTPFIKLIIDKIFSLFYNTNR